VVFHEGDPADTVHFVSEGRVVVRRTTQTGERVAYTVIGAGEAFGEMAMLSPAGRRTTTVEALEPTVTLSLRFADFERLCAEHPGVSRLLVLLLAERVSRLTDHLMEALYVTADQRVARRVLELCSVYAAQARPGVAVTLPVTQTEVAELAGASRPTTNRVLRRLAADGVLTLTRGRVVVHDAGAVRRAAGLPQERAGPPQERAGPPQERAGPPQRGA
jgi:CRP-like cAMP-binding protein